MLYLRTSPGALVWIVGLLITYGVAAFHWMQGFNYPDPLNLGLVLAIVPSAVLLIAGLSSTWQSMKPQVAKTFAAVGWLLLAGLGVIGQLWWYAPIEADTLPLSGAIGALAFGGAILVALWLRFDEPAQRRAALVAAAACVFCWAVPPLIPHTARPLIGALQGLAVLGALSWATHAFGMRRMFGLITALLGFRVISIYFEVFGSLLGTGVGLIVGGLLTLAVIWAWTRVRKRSFEATDAN